MNNKINTILSDEALRIINEALDAIAANTESFIGLTPAEGKSLSRIDAHRYLFVKKCIGAAKTYPQLVPPHANYDEAVTDITLYEQVREPNMRVQELARKIADTGALAGHESYAFGRAIYEQVGIGAKNGVPGMQALYEELKPFFEKQGPKKSEKK
jgi:hypothetical protein